jgi:hypothetical protein
MWSNSSISSSDPAAAANADDPGKGEPRAWLRNFIVATAACFLGAAVFIIAADPFDTGRFALLNVHGVPETPYAYAMPSRSRDMSFDAAILGNSVATLLDPERLSALTGRHFVQLSLPGTHATEANVVGRSFLAHHQGRPVAVLLTLDPYWCESAPTLAGFPFWLFGSTPSYLAHVVSGEAMVMAFSRIGFRIGLAEPARRDGYDNVERLWVWNADEIARRLAIVPPSELEDGSTLMPQLDVIRGFIARAGAGSRFVLLWTPVHVNALPVPGSPAERRLIACKASFAGLAEQDPSVRILDWRVRGPLASDINNFWDPFHYRGAVARNLEVAAAEAFNR